MGSLDLQTCPALVGAFHYPKYASVHWAQNENLDHLPAQAEGTSFHSQPEYQGWELVQEFIKTIYVDLKQAIVTNFILTFYLSLNNLILSIISFLCLLAYIIKL